jgi:tetratricopeptide (TPR) repeat protein
VYALARRAARQALDLDPEWAPAHTGSALLLLMSDWDWEAAEAHYRRAVELAPNSPVAHGSLRYYFTLTARYDDAISQLERWRDLDPLSTDTSYPTLLAWHNLALRRHDLVIAQPERGLPIGVAWRAVASAILGRSDDVRSTCERALSNSDPNPRLASACGFAFGRIGDRSRGRAVLDELKRRAAKGHYLDPFLLATVEAGLQDKNATLASLGRAAAEHSPLMIELTTAPWFDELHGDPRYVDLLRRIGFPQHSPLP